jgi:type II secretory pathway component PulF
VTFGVLIVVGLLLGLALILARHSPRFREIGEGLILRIPWLRSLYTTGQRAKLAGMISDLARAGVPTADAVVASGLMADSAAVGAEAEAVRRGLEEGDRAADHMNRGRLLAGPLAGGLREDPLETARAMNVVSELLGSEMRTRVHRARAVLHGLAILAIAFLVVSCMGFWGLD